MRTAPPAVLVALVVTGAAAGPAHARAGDLDRGFGTSGGVALPFGGGPIYGGHAVERRDGKVVLATSGGVLQLTRSGAVDPGFGASGEGHAGPPQRHLAEDATLDRRGRAVILASTLVEPRTAELVRLGRDGRPDAAFGPEGRRAIPIPFPEVSLTALALDSRGRMLLSGTAFRDGRVRVLVGRLRADGTPDPGFGRAGFVLGPAGGPTGPPIVRPGRIYAGFERGSGATAVMGLRGDGRPLRGFGRRGRTVKVGRLAFARGPSFAPGPGRSLLVAGKPRTSRSGSGSILYVTRLRADGRADRRFGRRGLVRLRRRGQDLVAGAISRDRRGRILVAANQLYGTRVSVYRLRRNGAADRAFGRRGAVSVRLGGRPGFEVTSAGAEGIAAGRSGRILVSGTVYDDYFELRDDLGNPYAAVTVLRGR